MVKRNSFIGIFAALGMLVLIFDGKTALSGAFDGMILCFTTLVPSLFPFFILSILLTGSLSGQDIPFLRPITRLCKMPQGCESVLAAGILGGYPVGAQNVGLLHRNGQLTALQAARIIPYCNNAGPAFIFGVLGSVFSRPLVPWLIWLIQILSAMIVACLLPPSSGSESVHATCRQIRITGALEQAVHVMALVCGWVILARMLIAFLDRWFLWLLSKPLAIALCGILELSNGCIRLTQVPDEGLRFLLACALLSAGGICVTMQTASVSTGIPMKFYFSGKLLQSCISILLSCFILPIYFGSPIQSLLIYSLAATGIGAGCVLYFRFFEKTSRISAPIGV